MSLEKMILFSVPSTLFFACACSSRKSNDEKAHQWSSTSMKASDEGEMTKCYLLLFMQVNPKIRYINPRVFSCIVIFDDNMDENMRVVNVQWRRDKIGEEDMLWNDKQISCCSACTACLLFDTSWMIHYWLRSFIHYWLCKTNDRKQIDEKAFHVFHALRYHWRHLLEMFWVLFLRASLNF